MCNPCHHRQDSGCNTYPDQQSVRRWFFCFKPADSPLINTVEMHILNASQSILRVCLFNTGQFDLQWPCTISCHVLWLHLLLLCGCSHRCQASQGMRGRLDLTDLSCSTHWAHFLPVDVFFPEFDTAVSSLVGQVRSRAFQVRCQEHIDIVPVKLRCHCQSGQVPYTPRSRLGPGTSLLAVGFLPITSPEVQHPRLQCSKRIVTAQEFPNTKYQVCSRNIQSFAFLRTSNKTIFHISDPNH